jgi:hypothetical protein
VIVTEGRVGGTKTFRYLVVPDSVGALLLPAVRYAYFDLGSDQYRELGLAPASVPVGPRGETAAATALPPPLVRQERPAFTWSIAHGVPDWVWIALVAIPPLLVSLKGWVAGRARWRRRPRRAPVPADGRDLRAVEAALDQLIVTLAPDPDRRFGHALAAAVRAAGADAELAGRVASVRERLLARRYGPTATPADDQRLAAEAADVVRRLGGSLRGHGAGALLLAALCVGGRLEAQNPAPEQLYESGALHAAADGFARRAGDQPAVAGHWYNLGAAYYRLGEPGRAEAAWVRARRLDPREPSVRRALELTPPPDVASTRWTWSPPVTPEELLLGGAAGWILGWLGWVLRPRHRERWLVLLVFAGAGVLSGLALRVWYRRPIAIVLDDATLRLSPHGRAPAIVPVERGSAVRVVGHAPGWILVRAAGGREGWMPDAAVAAIAG